jgi:hypothetical protein
VARSQLACAFVAIAATALASPAQASPITGPTYSDLTFTGTVQYVRGDTITVRNPDNTTTTVSSSDVPAYRFEPGATVTTTIRIDLTDSAFANAGCGGSFKLVIGDTGANACDVDALVTTPFGRAGLGGTGGDANPFLRGMGIIQDPATGELSVNLAGGSYSLGWVGVNPYFWDSATQTLSGPNSTQCVNTFDCLAGTGTGTLDSLSFLIPIAGDFGTYRPGFNVGYDAGSVGTMTITGAFQFSGTSGSVDVPEPPIALLTGMSLIALAVFRRRKIRTRQA